MRSKTGKNQFQKQITKKHQQMMRKWSQNPWKKHWILMNKSMEKSTKHLAIVYWKAHSSHLKLWNSQLEKVRKHNVLYGIFEYPPFCFEGPARTKAFKKRCQTSLKNTLFLSTIFQKSFTGREHRGMIWNHSGTPKTSVATTTAQTCDWRVREISSAPPGSEWM